MEMLTVFERRTNSILEAFEEALNFQELRYPLSRLHRYGFEDETEILLSIKRAIRVCKELGLNTHRHFGYFYKVDMDKREVTKEWKASKLGFYLVLCNGMPDNPYTAAFQLEMVKAFLSKLD